MGKFNEFKILKTKLVKTSDFNIPDSFDYSTSVISWDSAEIDTLQGWNGSNPTRITPPIPGWYRIEAHYLLTVAASGDFGLVVNPNGWGNGGISSTVMHWGEQQIYNAGSVATGITVRTYTKLVAGDYWECLALQKTGADRNCDHNFTYFSMTLMGV